MLLSLLYSRQPGAHYKIAAQCLDEPRFASALCFVKQPRLSWAHEVEERLRKARVRSHARLAAAGLYACERSSSKNQCPVSL
jgi:hypothetical protein